MKTGAKPQQGHSTTYMQPVEFPGQKIVSYKESVPIYYLFSSSFDPNSFVFFPHLSALTHHSVFPFFFSGTSHDWRLRCDAVNLYYTLFGLTRPSCLPLPELGLVLNLKEKKAVLNPTIKPELGVGTVMDTPASIGIHGVGMSYTAVSGLGSF